MNIEHYQYVIETIVSVQASTVVEFAVHEPSLVAKDGFWLLFRLLFGFSVVLTLVGLIDIFVLDYFLSIFDL